MNRKEARELLMKCLFQMEAQNEFTEDNAGLLLDREQTGNQDQYIRLIIKNLCENREEIDNVINENSRGWPVSRMPKADLAITRLAVCEILFAGDIPKPVSINEAVELAKKYGTDQSAGFINAVLKNVG